MEIKKIFNVFIGIGSFIIILTLFFLPSSANGTSVQARTGGSGYGDSGTFNPLIGKGLLTVATLSSDYSNPYVTELADAAIYGSDSSWDDKVWLHCQGLGIEPMAHARAATAYHSPPENYTWKAFAHAHAEITIGHRIRDLGTAPEPDLDIPLFLNYRLETSGGEIGIPTTAAFAVHSDYFNDSKQVDNGKSDYGTLAFNSSVVDYIKISAVAGAAATYEILPGGSLAGKSAQAVADPFLFIDPNWEYAQCFVVEQQSFLNPGEWVEVTRMWQNPVPTPASMLLFGSGLLVLIGYGRRKLFKTRRDAGDGKPRVF